MNNTKFQLAGLYGAEGFNWMLHTSNYSLSNPIGKGIFIVDVFGLPVHPAIENLTVGHLVNGFLGLAAVCLPIMIGKLFFENQHAIMEEGTDFFTKGFNKYITSLIGTIYGFVLITEFASLYLRILAETNSGPIPDMNSEGTGFIAMLIMSIALLLCNLGLGLYVAYVRHQLFYEEV